MIGYINNDWGMTGWYIAEDRRQQQEKYECELVRSYKDDCRNIAASIACEFRRANGNTTDEDYLSNTNNRDWHDWLLSEAAEQGKREYGENSLHDAMMLFCRQKTENFTDYAWVLTQVKQEAA